MYASNLLVPITDTLVMHTQLLQETLLLPPVAKNLFLLGTLFSLSLTICSCVYISNYWDFPYLLIITIDGLAVDWINHKLYWTDARLKEIVVYDLLQGFRKQLIDTGRDSIPRSIIVDPASRWAGHTLFPTPPHPPPCLYHHLHHLLLFLLLHLLVRIYFSLSISISSLFVYQYIILPVQMALLE